MTKPNVPTKVPYSSHTYVDHGESIYQRKRPDGNHVEGTAGRLATCTPFENETMSGRLQDWPVPVRDDLGGYRLRGRVPAPRFDDGYVTRRAGKVPITELRVSDDHAGQRAYVVRSYDQVILVANSWTGEVVWTNPARYSMTTGGHQSAACEWAGHDLRHPSCSNDDSHSHGDEPRSPSGARGGSHGQPSLADQYRY